MNIKTIGIIVGICCFMIIDVSAAGKKAKFKHADKNKDGRIGPKEHAIQKNFVKRVKVNTPREAKADKNNDGIVGPRETITIKSLIDRGWVTKADINNDGKVNPAELKAYWRGRVDLNNDGTITAIERKSFWQTKKAKVNTKVEERYDTDNNGYITGDEAVKMFADKLILINSQGKAKVNSVLEAEFDANNDGIIDRDEAEAMREAVGV